MEGAWPIADSAWVDWWSGAGDLVACLGRPKCAIAWGTDGEYSVARGRRQDRLPHSKAGEWPTPHSASRTSENVETQGPACKGGVDDAGHPDANVIPNAVVKASRTSAGRNVFDASTSVFGFAAH